MTAPAPKFRSVAATPLDVSDDVLNELSDGLGIPSLRKPEAKPSPAPAFKSPTDTSNLTHDEIIPVAAPIPAAKVKKRAIRQKAAPAVDPVTGPYRRMTIDMPIMLAEQLRRRAFEERATARYFFLRGLKETGFDVPDEELVPDGRLRT